MKKLLLTGVMLLYATLFVGQNVEKSTEQIIADIFEQYSAEVDEAIDYDTFYEKLINIGKHPLNLNQCTKEDLEQIPFLSPIQVENILYYLYKFGKLNSVYELQLIDGIDATDIYRLLPFVRVGEAEENEKKLNWNDLWRYGEHRIYFRVDRDLEQKSGYISDSSKSKYLGSAFYNSCKYRYQFSDRVQAGFTLEKDAGEQIFTKQTPFYDFASAYFLLQNIGKVSKLIVGDFKANFGFGLVLQSGFGACKSSYVLNVFPFNQGLTKSGSTDEFNFLRGVGATIKSGNLEFSGFYSNKMEDADTTGKTFSSFYKTGYHRTSSEVDKKNTINIQTAGTNITFGKNNIKIGLTAVYTKLDHFLMPEESHSNFFRFRGDRQITVGCNYRFRVERLNFFGETATTDKLAIATLNGLLFSPISTVSLVTLYRCYPKEYDSFYSGAFSESSRVSNESGFYSGVEIYPFKKWKLSAYADVYKFPWTRFSSVTPTVGSDFLVQTDFNASRDLLMLWRWKYENGVRNQSGDNSIMTNVADFEKSSLRYQLNFTSGKCQFKTLIEGNIYKASVSKMTYGLTALQDISYSFASFPLEIDVRYQIFDVKNYDNRIYTYENDILYAFSIPAIYGIGSRCYLNMKYELTKKATLWLKASQTVYADGREFCGSGNELLKGHRQSEIRFMIGYNL